MYIEEIRLRNFKNFRAEKGFFKSDVNVIIGENDSGKTNFLDAIRLVLDKKMPWYDKEIKEEFFSSSLNSWKGHLIIISIIFNDLNPINECESAFAFKTGSSIKKGSLNLFIMPNKAARNKLYGKRSKEELKALLNEITIDDYESYFTSGLDVDYSMDSNYYNLLGNIEEGEYKLSPELDEALIGCKINTTIDSIRNELFNFTYIDALRDSVREMNQKSNPLMTLIRQKEPNVKETEKNDVKTKIEELNNTIGSVEEIKMLKDDINKKIKESVGYTYSPSVDLKSDMSSDIKDIFRNLKLKSNIGFDIELSDLGLGSNNVIYIALKLLENMNKKSKYFLLLFEEPEAHLHKHLQMSLFEKTGLYANNNVQIIMTTHSDNISAASKIGSMTVIQKGYQGSTISNPSKGLDADEIESLERYLDVKRSELLFSKSVILVEGDAEEIMIPIMVKQVLGLSLDELGVSIINIGSVGFKNVYKIFNSERIRKYCAIVSDLDTPIDSSNQGQVNANLRGEKRYLEIEKESSINEYIKPFFGKYTFEIELLDKNGEYYKKLIHKTYKDDKGIENFCNEIVDPNVAVSGKRALAVANYNSKGWNALLLSKYVDGKFHIPNYIVDALLFVAKDSLKNFENLKTIFEKYCEVYEDEKVMTMIKSNEFDVQSLINNSCEPNSQIIEIIKKVIL